MDTMEIIGGAESEGLDFGPALEDVDMDLLVGTSFNKAGSRNAPRDVEPRQMTVEDLDGDTALMQANSFLTMDLLGDLSPRNISDGREIPMDKDCQLSFLVDRRDIQLPDPLPHTVVLTDPTTSSSAPLGEHPLSLRQTTALPETTLTDELESFSQHPFPSQNEWQDVATIALSTSPQSVPSSATNPLKMLQLDSQLRSLTQHLQGTEPNPPPTFVSNGGPSLKIEQISMKSPRRRREKVKQTSNWVERGNPAAEAAGSSSGKGTKKKTGGRRKVRGMGNCISCSVPLTACRHWKCQAPHTSFLLSNHCILLNFYTCDADATRYLIRTKRMDQLPYLLAITFSPSVL